jgi:hypothetical protein
MKLNLILLNFSLLLNLDCMSQTFLFMCQGFTSRLFGNIIEFATEVKKKNYSRSSGDYIVAG